jgi:putative toxin-antitoxin system antitoxin component (TIGR02293 family)
MAKAKEEKADYAVLEKVPQRLGDVEVIGYMDRNTINASYLQAIKQSTRYKDDKISTWLNISPRTMRSYHSSTRFKKNTSEQILLLLAVFKHGIRVFGSKEAFDDWLDTPNFYFDNKKPIALLDTSSGVRYINDRLTAMEYGDNV